VVNLPVFSPDGKWLAFSAQRNGNVDVYLIPAEGGLSRRLTWHPGLTLFRIFHLMAYPYFLPRPEKLPTVAPAIYSLYR
jgi:tricorn protease-like protein